MGSPRPTAPLQAPPFARPRAAVIAVLAAGAVGAACLLSAAPATAQGRPAAATQAAAGTASAAPATVRHDTSSYADLRYRHVGPFRGGRVTTVAGVASQPHTFYFGSTGGGIWKTTDAGATWNNISDGFLAATSMGAIRVAPSDPNIIYAATGSDGLRSNVSTGLGIYKSTDAGATWSFIGLRDAGQTGAIEVHPTNPRIAFVSVIGNAFRPSPTRGLYRTRDGGANWERVLYVSDSTGSVDVEFNPADPDELYATMWRGERKPWTIISGAREGGVYKSTDGGTTWRKLGKGLPQGLFGKADLAVSAADPDRVYVLIEAPGDTGGVYRSDDRGETWTQTSHQNGLTNRPFYYLNLDADPTNADRIFAGAEGFWMSTDGGKTFRNLPTPHSDNHDVWINPNDPDIWIQANDGGVNVTLDDGRTWSTQYNQPTAEIYQVAADNRYPYRLYGAQQDNSTLMIPSLPLAASRPDNWMQQWQASAGCETGPVIPHPTEPDIIYGNCKGQFTRLNMATGQEKNYWVGAQYLYGFSPESLKYRFQRIAPIELSPFDPKVIYHGSQFVHRTTDEGVTWETISPDLTANDPRGHEVSGKPITRDATGEEYYSTLYVIRESPRERGVIWTGANDGPIHLSRDNGKTWVNVTPKGVPAGGRVQSIEPSRHQDGKAYATVLLYLLGDSRPYVYRTTDYGKSWTPITNGIRADEPTRVVREDPLRPGLLYLGTEFGMYVSFDDGANWQSFQQNLPITPVMDIVLHDGDLALATQGRGFWIMDDLAPLRQLGDRVSSARAWFFTPSPAMRTRYPVTMGSTQDPEYPPIGAYLDYNLAAAATAPLTLEITDASGTVVHTARSAAAGAGDAAAAGGAGQGGGMRRPGASRGPWSSLDGSAGMHRYVWDLSVTGTGTAAGGRGRGPLATPGTYQARLTMGDWSQTRPVEVVLDPRLVADGLTTAMLADQLALTLKVRDAIAEANRTLADVRAAAKQVAPGSRQAAQLRALEARLATTPVRYSQPMLVDQLGYLYGMISRADQELGRDATIRFAELGAELESIRAGLRQLTGAATTAVP
ncbi:MAG: WD40/YVTN/BNR-like repeat-containing protein [Gemmatimonadaceae bacterium]